MTDSVAVYCLLFHNKSSRHTGIPHTWNFHNFKHVSPVECRESWTGEATSITGGGQKGDEDMNSFRAFDHELSVFVEF